MEVKSNNKNGRTTNDDPFALWERLQESKQKKMKLLKEGTEKLQDEKDTMNSAVADANISNDDIIVINAGGKIISALRSTLCLVAPDTMFSYMFSGRWEESLKRDSNGVVFIDENSELIEIIVDFLRMKKREDPSKPAPPPTVHNDKKDNFLSLLNYYGLTEFFYPSLQPLVFDIANIAVMHPDVSSIDVVKSEDKIQFSQDSDAHEYEHVVCIPSLDSSGEGAFWKVTIDQMDDGWLFLGIVGNLNFEADATSDSTAYGMDSTDVWRGGGSDIDVDWTGFGQGDCVYFKFKSNKLTVYNVRKDKKFEICTCSTGNAYILFDLGCGTKVTLEPLDEEKHKYLL